MNASVPTAILPVIQMLFGLIWSMRREQILDIRVALEHTPWINLEYTPFALAQKVELLRMRNG